ncbi:MAG TPA: DUF72 domain-containing protein [Tepidisphaeraceae bacterium]|jgi:uncharacterized protein YecE (DUF72 family)|nr:DUF72 domain-containing protein [Tepidisphaeraceae bacterium]
MSKSPHVRIGISGWTYTPWRGVFYPKDLPHKRELEYAGGMLNSIEINGSFYSLQRPGSYQVWYDATPPAFVFSLKGPRYVTHMKRLRDVEKPLANFFASGVLGLKEKLGPILWQFPPNFVFDAEKFAGFFDLLPRDTSSAATLAMDHDEWLKGRVLIETDANRPIRHAVEIRHPSFADSKFIDLLRKHEIALVFADTATRWPYAEDLTADFVYARLHGDEELYASGYSASALDWWARRLAAWRDGKEPADRKTWSEKKAAKAKQRDVYVYFDNDVKVKAPFDAMSLADRMGEQALGVNRTAKSESPRISKKLLNERVRSHWPGVKS